MKCAPIHRALSVEFAIRGDRMRGSAEIIVIGGGIAGLACARALGQQGKRGLILEARNRLGGRIHSVVMGGVNVDLGASWLEGKKRNPIRNLAEEAGARLVRTDYESLELFDLDGRELKGREHRTIDDAVERTMQDLLRGKRNAPRDLSIEPIIKRAFDGAGLSPTEARGVRWSLASEIISEYACDFHDLSLSQWDEDYEYGGADYQFADGFSVLIHFLAQECKRLGFEMQTGAAVQSVDWSTREVCVGTAEQDYRSAKAVVTLPLGVLKHQAIRFGGKLPEDKQRAIERLGMGTLNKVLMTFGDRFWPKHADYFGCLGQAHDTSIDFWNLEPVTGMPILAALFGGHAAVRLEAMSDGEIQRAALAPLRRVFGTRVEEPLALQVTRWTSDPFAHGAYSYVPPGATYDDYEALARPIGNRLFFAGEATSVRYPSTVHGAYESGERAAKQMLR
jgi:monoamine oxidase